MIIDVIESFDGEKRLARGISLLRVRLVIFQIWKPLKHQIGI